MSNSLSARVYKISLGDLSANVFLNGNGIKPVPSPELVSDKANIHFHTHYELFFADSEPLVMLIGEEEKSFSHSALCVPPFVRHCVKNREDAYCMRVELRAEGCKMAKLFSQEVQHFAVGDFSFECLKRLNFANEKGDETRSEEVGALLKLILLDLYEQNVIPPTVQRNSGVDDYCLIIEDFVHNRYREHITLATLGEAMHLSTKQVSRVIRSRYRATLGELLNERRLKLATVLLKTTDLSVAEISEQIFDRPANYFFQLFRKKYGVSPLKYRKTAREEQEK